MTTRRAFLGHGLAALSCAALLGATDGLGAWAAPPAQVPGDYLLHKGELMSDFEGVTRGAREMLAARLGPQAAGQAAEEALRAFEALIPTLPDVGGGTNPMTPFVIKSAWYVALHGPMKKRGCNAEDVGRLMYDLNARKMGAAPKEAMLAAGARTFSPSMVDGLRQWADESKKRRYPANWVMTFVPGDGQAFDFGYDMVECACLKYLRSQGVPEVAPFMCPNDFLMSRIMDTGLARRGTLAQGDRVCDFRYKKGRPVTQDWSTEIGLIRQRLKSR